MGKCGKKPRLLSMMALTAIFFLAEIITGYLTNSMALVADSFHMLSDVLSILIGYLAVHYSGKKSKTNTYDWARAEVLGAMANAVFLMALVFTIVIAAIQRLIEVEKIEQPLLVLGVGVAGLVINLVGLLIFGSHAHGHSHDHGGHDHTSDNGRHDAEGHDHDSHPSMPALENGAQTEGDKDCPQTTEPHKKATAKSGGHMNMQAVFLHVLGDALGSIVVIISALTIYFVQDDWRYYIDPMMSLVTSIIISCTTIPLLKRASMILLQNPPGTVNVDAVIDKMSQVPGVVSVHDFHVWQLSGNCIIATTHVILEADCKFTDIAKKLKKIFHEVDIHATTIQPEYIDDKKTTSLLPLELAKEDLSPTRCTCQEEGISSDELHECEVMVQSRGQNMHADELRVSGGTSSDEVSSSDCLLTCQSKECLQRMCCDGARRRFALKQSSFVNPNFLEPENQSAGCSAIPMEPSYQV